MEELAWRTRIEGSQGLPEREFNGPVVGLQQRYRDGLAALGADFADASTATSRTRGSTADPDVQATALRARVRGHVRRPGVRRQPRRRGLGRRSASSATSSRAATPTTRCRGREQDARSTGLADARLRRRHRRLGPGRVDRRRRAHRRGLVGDRAREGPQPPARPRAAVRADRATSRTTRSSSIRRHFLGPDPLLEPRTYRRTEADGDRLFTGDVNNLPVDGRRRRLPRRRQAARASARRTSTCAPRSGRSTAPTSPTGRCSTTTSSRTTPRPSGSIGVAGDAAPTRSRRGAAARTRCRRAPTCSAPSSSSAAAERARAAPVPRADRRELDRRTTTGRRATTAGSAAATAARSTPRATRSRRCGGRCAPAGARCGPSRT